MVRKKGFGGLPIYQDVVIIFPVLVTGMESDTTNGIEKRADSRRRSREVFYQHKRWFALRPEINIVSTEISIEIHIYFGEES